MNRRQSKEMPIASDKEPRMQMPPDSVPPDSSPACNARIRNTRFVIFAFAITALFSAPLYFLCRFALHSDLYSYIPLVPFISIYLVWIKRDQVTAPWTPATSIALALGVAALTLAALDSAALLLNWRWSLQDRLTLSTLAWVCALWSGCAWILGGGVLRAKAFPAVILLFAVPLPVIAQDRVESFLQHVSADAAYALLQASGMPVFREGTTFLLPGVPFDVAPECSGIHSTLVLFITGLIAGHLFLRKPWTKVTLAVGVVVLGVIRNAVRIFILAQLSVHVDPGIFDSPLHHWGGPIFFAVSLVPFFLLLWLLRKLDRRSAH